MAAFLSKSKTLKPQIFLFSIPRNPPLRIPLSAFYSSETTLPRPLPPAATSSQTQEKERGRWSKLLLFLPGAITFGLGTWQIFRRQEKIEMLEYRKKRLEMEPIVWNRMPSSVGNLEDLEFRKVTCEGIFDEDKSIYVGPRSRAISGVTENGYYIITPLIPKTSDPDSLQLPILVNRGWVPRSWRNKVVDSSHDVGESLNSKTADIQPTEKNIWWKFWSKKPSVSKEQEPNTTTVRVTGVVRQSEKPSIFVPENDPDSGQWFYVDVPMIARASGLPENTLYIEDINENASASNPYPVPKDVDTLIRFSVMPQDHLNYTITWYSLSAAVTFMAFKRIRPKKIRR